MKLRILTLILFLSVFANSLLSQEGIDEQTLKFKHFSLNEGLSQSSVLCVLQCSKGFLWFGTRDGLNKYDGHSFKTYRYNSKDPNSLSNSFIRSLYEDDYGVLWVGTANGLNKYSINEDNFERINLNDNKKNNLEVWSIIREDKDYIWIGTNFGLEKFNINTSQSAHYEDQIEDNILSSNLVRSLLKAKNGDLWICTTERIDVYNPVTNDFRSYDYLKDDAKQKVPNLYEDRNNNLWLGHTDGLAIFDKENDTFKPFKIENNSSVSKITDEVRSINLDFLGNLWVGTYNGLYIIKNDKSYIYHYLHDENNPYSLSQNSIYKIFEDNKGDMWLGTYAGGINYYDRSFDVFKNFTSGTNNSKLNYKVISSIIEDSDNNLWIGTEGGGINFLDTKTGRFDYIVHDKNNPKSISANNVKSMIRTKKGDFWIGTHDGGLNFLNTKTKPYSFESYRNIIGDNTSLSSDRVISLFEDYTGNIWVGTSGGSLNVLNTDSNLFERNPKAVQLIGNYIFTISKSSNNDILFVSGDKGLAKVNIKTFDITPLHYKEELENSNNRSRILCIYEDSIKNLWIATEGDGLYYYESKLNKSTRYGLSEGLPNEVIYSIVPDNSNNLWLSTNYGLSSFSLKTRKFKNFDVSDGLISNEFNYGASAKLKNGTLMFGGVNGLNFFKPKDIIENAFIPPISITSILVNNKPRLLRDNEHKEITLKYNQNVFTFNFVAISYSQPSKNEYAYKLDGFDDDWNYVGSKKSATYTNLDSGDYTFKVKAASSNGVWNEKGETLSVKILPAPWKTWWAYLIYLLLITGIFLLIRKYSLIRIYEKNQLKQERLEKEKIEGINKMKLMLFTNISHDFRTPLTLIIGPLERMLKEKLDLNSIRQQHEIMHRNASVLLQLINQLLDFRKSESGKLQLRASKNNIVPFIQDIKISFEELAKTKKIDYTFDTTDDNIDIWFDKINLKKVIYNLLSNAFKFTPDHGKISIELSVTNKKNKQGERKDLLKIIVKDNGKGIDKNSLKFIFDRFFQLGQDDNKRSGTGIGLALSKNLVELHHGTIKAKSTLEKGTSFIISIPMGKSHLKEEEIISEAIEDTSSNSFYTTNTDFIIKEALVKEREDSIVSEKPVAPNKLLPTLLLVEDNKEVREFIKGIFSDKNNILEAENGEIALELTKKNKIDLIISDVMMPIMDGIMLCEKIKTNIKTSHIPVILLTAKTSDKAQKSGYTIGADAYITKPFDSGLLEIRVNNLLTSRRNFIKKFKKDIILEPKEITATSTDEIFLKKAIDLVEKNMTNADFSITMFIDEMSVSRSVLYRKLKALTGHSITDFIRTIKLKRARQLILSSDLNISEIAYDLGFNDLKYFRKSFKKLFNELPSEYRSNHKVAPQKKTLDDFD